MAKTEGEFKLRFPPPQELAKIAAITAAFSLMSGFLVRAPPKGAVKL